LSEVKHLCLGCAHAGAEVPAEVLITGTNAEGRTVTVNIADELKKLQTEMKKRYKHVHYCPQLKAVVVGADLPTQMRKECGHYTKA